MNLRLFPFLLFACACGGSPLTLTVEEQYPNRLYFSIDSLNPHIVVPVQMNDTVVARLVFDTDNWPELVLDSGFFFSHQLMSDMPFTELRRSFPVMNQLNIASFRYDTTQSLTIGRTPVNFHRTDVMPLNMLTEKANGIFNIPEKDTTHVWELNFENNYLEVYSADSFRMPEGCMVFPVLGQPDAYTPGYCIQIPLQMMYAKDTLHSNYLYRIDSGMLYELLLAYPAGEITSLLNRLDDTWYAGNSSDNKRWLNIVSVKIAENFVIDTLALSTTMNSSIRSYRYAGLHFLRHFNVFFDMKRQQIGLLPVRHKYSIEALRGLYFCVDTIPTNNNAYKINFISALKDNYYQAAGLSLHDELISVNGYAYKDIVLRKFNIGDIIDRSDTLVFSIIRNKQYMKITVPIPEEKRKKR
jgi:hypothetical protein